MPHDREKVLLSFTGFHDPFASSGVAGSEQEGPVLSLVRLRQFSRVYLFSTPRTLSNAQATVEAMRARHPGITVESCDLSFENPTDYFAILAALRDCFKQIAASTRGAEYYIATASGTPQMHACWLLLAASGEIPARLLQTHNVKFTTNDAATVTEVDLTRPEIPRVRSNSLHDFEMDDEQKPDAIDAIQELQIIGDHEQIKLALQKAATFGPYDTPVLITGESGTGKDKIAQLIHRVSKRKGQLVAVNCAGVPEQLAESMLFGHVKGAFTGATENQIGKIEQAHEGTLFLDELGELSLNNQAKLLRALQDKVIEQVGSTKSKKIDCRIVAATNANLQDLVKHKKFRDDLYFRIATAVIELPPLRARNSDIPKLALHFLDQINQRHRFKKPRVLAPDTLTYLMGHDWPGNVRELCNAIENAGIQATQGKIEPKHFSLRRTGTSQTMESLPDPHDGFSLDGFLGQIRSHLYTRAMELSDGNASKAARLLDVTPQAVAKFSRAADTTKVHKK